MVKVVSFCIYGGLEKYCRGLIENIKIVQKYLPDFMVWVYVGTDVPKDYLDQYSQFSNVKLINTNQNGASLMCYRYYPIDDPDVEVALFRDCDSRIYQRDQWCINQFINSNYEAHIIHDHFWHKTRITGGMWGIKQGLLKAKFVDLYNNWINNNTELENKYGTDQIFLEQIIYPMIKNNTLIHSNIIGYPDEQICLIPVELDDNEHFIGNVYDFKDGQEFTQFRYFNFNVPQHIRWLSDNKQYLLVIKICNSIDLYKYRYNERFIILDHWYMSHFYLKQYEQCQEVLSKFSHTYINNFLLLNTNHLIKALQQNGVKIIATTNVAREPHENEMVICYGNYLYDVDNLPHSNKLYRHVYFFNTIQHDIVEYHKCWNKIDRIYIINLPERVDRYMEVLVELCHMQAPLQRIYHYKARKDDVVPNNKQCNIYWGATNNHYEVTKDFIDNNYEYCLILEDDFTFTNNYKQHFTNLTNFFERNYDFDVCLISSSKEHEYREYDDLLNLTYQECTTTSGYILRKETAHKVLECFKTGCDMIKQTQQYGMYVCDRYWAKLQKDNKFFVFKNKLGYQRPCFSSITSQTNLNLD